jgi:hypothetical protein
MTKHDDLAFRLIGVVPLRYVDCFDADGAPVFTLDNAPLWDFTLATLCHKEGLSGVIVAYDDDRFLPYLEKWTGKCFLLKRPEELSAKNVTVLNVLEYVAKALPDEAISATHLALFEQTHPLRPDGYLTEISRISSANPESIVVPCKTNKYTFWRKSHPEEALERLSGSGETADVIMLQEMLGLGAVFPVHLLDGNVSFTDDVTIIPIQEDWAAFDVSDMLKNPKVLEFLSKYFVKSV